ncbi:hypothetical protein JCM8202_006133 [Rhodotorula sphaerocarpa]
MSYGGGFMAGGSQGGSQGSPSGGDKRSGTSALRPVTIAQCVNAEQAFADAEFFIDGAEVKDVTVVACVRNIANNSTAVNMLIEDGTGQIDARWWKDPAAEDAQEEPQLDTYVRIIGSLKTFSNKRHITANRFRAITDHNELLFHAVECVYVHKFYVEGPPGGAKMQDVTHQTFDAGANPYAGGAATTSVQEVYNDLPTLQRSIMQYVSTRNQAGDAGEEGIHVEAVCRSVGGEEREVRQEIANLIEEGHLYETIDESHILPTAS